MDVEQYLIQPGSQVSLAEMDPADTGEWTKKTAKLELETLKERLNELQQLLYATQKHALLVVLQGMDTSGKDGTIKHVMGAFNPQGVQVTSFKVPTAEELAHDFMWRVHHNTPRLGMAGIFNRSHYEDVLVVRVEELVPESVWSARYELINAFERGLQLAGTVIIKLYLHISKGEQRRRLEKRLREPRSHWKFHMGDLRARARWRDYEIAYEEALSRCSTEAAPWYVVPADHKWYRNLVVSEILLKHLSALQLEWPPLEPEAKGIVIE